MRGQTIFLSFLFGILFALALTAAAPEKAYANCFGDPPRGLGAGHHRAVASGADCGDKYYCTERNSDRSECFNPDGTRADWVPDRKARGGWRHRNAEDDARDIANYAKGVIPCEIVGATFGRAGYCKPGTGTARPQTAANKDSVLDEFKIGGK